MSSNSKLPPTGGIPEKSQPLAGGLSETTRGQDISLGRFGKLARMLHIFASGASLNTFEAKEVGDTCLHTTVSDLQARHGITFSRRWEQVSNRFGTRTRVLRYQLEGSNLDRAQALFNGRAQP